MITEQNANRRQCPECKHNNGRHVESIHINVPSRRKLQRKVAVASPNVHSLQVVLANVSWYVKTSTIFQKRRGDSKCNFALILNVRWCRESTFVEKEEKE